MKKRATNRFKFLSANRSWLKGWWIVYLLCLGVLLPDQVKGQFQVTVNGTLEMGLSKAGDDSHFFYNGINKEYTDWRAGLKEVNGMVSLLYGKQWSLNTRVFYGREEDGPLARLDMPLLNLTWKSKAGRLKIQMGRFINPFGQFNEKQLPMDRPMVGLPLTHIYSSRISNIFGGWYYPLGAPTNLADRSRGWPLHYYGGYQTGLRADWVIKPDRWMLSAALTTGAAFAPDQLKDPLKMGVNARLQWQPSWYWTQGFSVSRGHIMKRTPQNAALEDLNCYSQLMVGTDITTGYGFWELTGEWMAGWHRVPFYDPSAGAFVRNDMDELAEATLFQAGGYLNLKIEPPFLTGAWVAAQAGWKQFGDHPLESTDTAWDSRAMNYQLGMGYKVTRWLLLRSTYAWLDVKGASGAYDSWQTSLTAHF